MALRWKIPFVSLDNTQYTVNIYDSDWSGTVTTLQGAAEPFITQESDDDDPFTPVRSSSGYLRFIDTDDIAQDISAVSAFSRYVELVDDDNTVYWIGYVAPEEYSGAWEPTPREVELPIVSATSLLNNGQFEAEDDIVTIGYLLKRCLDSVNVGWNNVYFPIIDNSFSSTSIKELLYSVFDWNFVEDESTSEKTYTGSNPNLKNPDDGQKYIDIVNEICMFFGWQLREVGNDLYFVASDYTLEYSRIAYDELDSSSPTVTEVDFSLKSLPAYRSADHNIDILSGRSQIRLTVNANSTDGDELVNISTEEMEYERALSGQYDNSKHWYTAYAFKYTDYLIGTQVGGFPALNMTGTIAYTGAAFAKDCFSDLDSRPTSPSDCSDTITFCGMDGTLGTTPQITFKSEHGYVFLGSGSVTLRLSGKVCVCKDFYEEETSINPHCQMNIILKIGDYYYDGTTGWSTTESTYTVRLGLITTWDEDKDEDKEDGAGYLWCAAHTTENYVDIQVPYYVHGTVSLALCMPDCKSTDYRYVRISNMSLKVVSDDWPEFKSKLDYSEYRYNRQLDSSFDEVYTSDRKLGGSRGNAQSIVIGTNSYAQAVDISETLLDRMEDWYNRTIKKLTLTVAQSLLKPTDRYNVDGSVYIVGAIETNWRDSTQTLALYNNDRPLTAIEILCDSLTKRGGKFIINTRASYQLYVKYTPINTTTKKGVTWSSNLPDAQYASLSSSGLLDVHGLPSGATAYMIYATSVADSSIVGSVQIILTP